MWYSLFFQKFSNKYPDHNKAWFDDEGNFIPFSEGYHDIWYKTPEAQRIFKNKKYPNKLDVDQLIERGWTRVYPTSNIIGFDLPFDIEKIPLYIKRIYDYIFDLLKYYQDRSIVNILITIPKIKLNIAYPLDLFVNLSEDDLVNTIKRKILFKIKGEISNVV